MTGPLLSLENIDAAFELEKQKLTKSKKSIKISLNPVFPRIQIERRICNLPTYTPDNYPSKVQYPQFGSRYIFLGSTCKIPRSMQCVRRLPHRSDY